MVDITSPRAVRLATPRWLDARFVVGVLLVVVSVLAGARVFASANSYDRVLVAAHPLTVGERVGAGDFRVGQARLYTAGGHYVAAGTSWPVGYVVVRPVGAGELVPTAALSRSGTVDDHRLVSVPVAAGHFPAGLASGDLVDVYATARPNAAMSTPADSVLVLRRVQVAQVGTGAAASGGLGVAPSATTGVVLSVPTGSVASLVTALQGGSIDLVALPADAATAGGSS